MNPAKRRFNPSAKGNNPSFRAPRKPRVEKPETSKGYKALTRPELHVHAEGKRKGTMVIPAEIAERCGPDAAQVMGMISTHAATFQMDKRAIAGASGLSLRRTTAAIQKLVTAGYACYLPWRAGERNKGWVLQTNANGNIKPLEGCVLHYSLEDGSAATASRPQRRSAMRRAAAGLATRKRREAGKPTVLDLIQRQSYAETGGSENPPLASPIMVTQEEREKEPQTPLADAKRGLFSFLVRVDGSPMPRFSGDIPEELSQLALAEKVLNTPELRERFPLSREQEAGISLVLAHEAARQAEDLLEDDPQEIHFSREDFARWRECMHHFGAADLSQGWEMKAALDLHHARPTVANQIARAQLAHQLNWTSEKFHRGVHQLAAYPGALNASSVEALKQIPRCLTKGEHALTWLQTHPTGLLFLSSVSDPAEMPEHLAEKLLRKLRKGTVSDRNIHRLWTLTHFGNMSLTCNEACELLDMKHGLDLSSDNAVMGYRYALQRMRAMNPAVVPSSTREEFDFDSENTEVEGVFEKSLQKGKQLAQAFAPAMVKFKDVELALRELHAAGAHDTQDCERLACLWLSAQVDQNDTLLDQLRVWGAADVLRKWSTKFAAGRRWIFNIGCAWQLQHLPEITQTLGWASDTEWWLHNEIRQYAMRKGWEAFVDVHGLAHTVWSNSLLGNA